MRYLLPCSCGKAVAVSPSQAGGEVTCVCGQRLEAPRLRELQLLPVEEQAGGASTSAWGFRQGLLSVGLILAALLAAGGLWFARQAPEPPKPFDAEARRALVEKSLEQMSPTELWEMFRTIYEPSARRGLVQAESAGEKGVLAQIEFCETYRDRLWFAAGGVLVATLLVYALLPQPRSS